MRKILLTIGLMMLSGPALADRIAVKEPWRLEKMQKAIASTGYHCPVVMMEWDHGLSPIGPSFEVFCGDGKKVHQQLHYAIYPERRFVRVCKGDIYSICPD